MAAQVIEDESVSTNLAQGVTATGGAARRPPSSTNGAATPTMAPGTGESSVLPPVSPTSVSSASSVPPPAVMTVPSAPPVSGPPASVAPVPAMPGPSGAAKPTAAQLPALLVTPGALPVGWVVLAQDDGSQSGDLGTDCPANAEFALAAAPGAGLDVSWDTGGSPVAYLALKLFADRAARDGALAALRNRIAGCVASSATNPAASVGRWALHSGETLAGAISVTFESNDQRGFHAEVQALAAGDYLLVWVVGYSEPGQAIPLLDGLIAAQRAALARAG